MATNYSALFQPIRIGRMEVKNRLVVPAMESGFSSADGTVSDRLINHYETRAKGGFGLVIVEVTAVDPHGLGFANQLGTYDDKHLPGLAKLAECIHKHGAKAALQLYHPGRVAHPELNEGVQPVGPSPVPDPVFQYAPKEMTGSDIEHVIEHFAQAALRAKNAAFDAIEIHGAHGYLISQFMSAYANKRTDEYGRDFDGFMRFPVELIRRVRQVVGPDYPIIFRISGDEHVSLGRTAEGSARAAKRLVEEGVDAIHISLSVFEASHLFCAPPALEQGFNAQTAAVVKASVSVPVIVVGRIVDPRVAEEIITSGKADLVALGRQSIADPEWPNKVSQNRVEDIVKCLSCNEGCLDGIATKGYISCVQNPKVGRDQEYASPGAGRPKKVFIAGGGPAGLEAARTAAMWGHKVVLFEKSMTLGGQVTLAAIPPTKDIWTEVIASRVREVERLGVEIHLGRELTAEMVKQLSPEVLIIATGSEPVYPDIPGSHGKNVIMASEALTKPIEGREVVVVGGGLVGCETADYLSQHGKNVTIIEMQEQIAQNISPAPYYYLRRRLAEKNVKILTSTTVKAITDKGVLIESTRGAQVLDKADVVVIATGARSVNPLEASVRGLVPELYIVGDAHCPGKVLGAIQQAAETARNL